MTVAHVLLVRSVHSSVDTVNTRFSGLNSLKVLREACGLNCQRTGGTAFLEIDPILSTPRVSERKPSSIIASSQHGWIVLQIDRWDRSCSPYEPP